MAEQKISELDNLVTPDSSDLFPVVDVSEAKTKQTTFTQLKDSIRAVLALVASDISDFQSAVTNNTEVLANTAKRSYPTGDETKLGTIETNADVTDTANVDAAGATMNTDTDVSGNDWVVDEDNMASNSAIKVPTQQSVKAYVDDAAGASLLIDAAVTASSYSNSAAEETTFTTTVPANTLGANDVIKIKFFHKFTSTWGGGNTCTIRINYGGSAVISLTLDDDYSSTEISGEVYIKGLSSSSQNNYIQVTGGTGFLLNTRATSSSTVNSASSQTLSISFDHNTTESGTTHLVTAEILKKQ